MVLKQLRLSRGLTQDQLAHMSGLSVRTIQRIESGANASLESQKCIAAALEISTDALFDAEIKIDRYSDNWKNLPVLLKICFAFNYLQIRPSRATATRVEIQCHMFGLTFCLLGLYSEAALVGGLILLFTAYLYTALKWQGDKYGIWFETEDDSVP
ncbi:helix-turn-helix domain-containing protein [Pseudoalteromonas luteoviolacea]|uniref:helix-turn-helix domain-containing protein n=1 Tax=Pseudoalteromonas luteoviolacea TaxID=43657 RepID=UPI001B380728|nr:helix-turn-helix domain-containing protein [Pseudoalteromonas luteoviolacea]MBQ4810037.1 helix-turn-helix domain-containing protein [Pseudoalteromonas luteoviolacea]